LYLVRLSFILLLGELKQQHMVEGGGNRESENKFGRKMSITRTKMKQMVRCSTVEQCTVHKDWSERSAFRRKKPNKMCR
jgi:hypothetical protein